MDLREVFTPAAIAANWTEVASNQIPYLGATLFPAQILGHRKKLPSAVLDKGSILLCSPPTKGFPLQSFCT